MSRAFVKEDVDPPERARRARSASGLPPGAANYITAQGAGLLRAKLPTLDKTEGVALQELLASVAIVDPPEDRTEVAFGAKVTVRTANGALQTYRIVGVDELDLHPDAVSWISPIAKVLPD